MSLFPSAPGGVQVEIIPRWPGKIIGNGGVKAETSGGVVTVSSDIPSLVEVTPADNQGRFVQVWNEDADTNERVELQFLPTQSQSFNELTDVPTEFPPSAHTHVASEISDSTAVGRAVITAVDQAAARTAIGSPVDFEEAVDDRVAALLTAGTGIGLTYNDGAGTLVIASTGVAAVTQISSGTIGSGVAAVDITLPTGYRAFLIIGKEITPNSSGNYLYARLSYDGSTYATTLYTTMGTIDRPTGTNSTVTGPGTAALLSSSYLGGVNVGCLFLDVVQNGSSPVQINSRLTHAESSTGDYVFVETATVQGTGGLVVQKIRLLYSTGSEFAPLGKWALFGWKD